MKPGDLHTLHGKIAGSGPAVFTATRRVQVDKDEVRLPIKSPLDYFCTVREKDQFVQWQNGAERAEPAKAQVCSADGGTEEPVTLTSEVDAGDTLTQS